MHRHSFDREARSFLVPRTNRPEVLRPVFRIRRDALLVVGLIALLLSPFAADAGDLVSTPELVQIRELADSGDARVEAHVRRILQDARRDWRWGSARGAFTTTLDGTEKRCHPTSDANADRYLKDGAPDAFAQALGALLAPGGDPALARAARARVLELSQTSGFSGLAGASFSGQNQCILELAISLPVWVETARLLEETSVWTDADRDAFTSWLVSEAYPKVAWASRVRRNNWGAAGSAAASAIAHYVEGRVPSLAEVEPSRVSLSPAEARKAHDRIQADRIETTWRGDAECELLGIQPHGGVPEELRRGSTGCDGTYLLRSDSAHTYQTMHMELLVLHAEAMRRRGDTTLFQLGEEDGVPALLRGLLFVIDNPTAGGRSWPWGTRTGTLAVAQRYYGQASLARALDELGSSTSRGGRSLPYAHLLVLAQRAGPAAPILLDD